MVLTRKVSLPPGAPSLHALAPPWLGHDGSLVVTEFDAGRSRGPWAVIDVATGQAKVGRQMPQIYGALLDADGPALLGTAGGVVEVDLNEASIVRELRQGVGRGRDDAESQFVRLDLRHVLLGAVGKQTAKLLDVGGWSIVRSRLPLTPPWVVLSREPTRIWSLPNDDVVTLDATGSVTRRTPAPAALAAIRSMHGVYALVGRLQPRRGTGWMHALGRDVLPYRLQHHLNTPLEDVRLCRLDPRTLEATATRALGRLAKVVEGALGSILAESEQWTTGSIHRCFTTDSLDRPVLVTENSLVVLDPHTLEPLIDTELSDARSLHKWGSRNGLSRAVAVSDGSLHIADW